MVNKNLIAVVSVIAVVLIVFFIFLNKAPGDVREDDLVGTPSTSTLPSFGEIPLSELQIIACNAAHEAGECDSKLPDIDIVTKEECCKYLNNCCEESK